MIATALLLSLLGCDADPPASEGTACELPARARATPVAGDANGDGVVDIADGSAVHRWLFRRGDAPPCLAAADVAPDGVVDAGDGAGIWYHLFAGSVALPTLAADACAAPEVEALPACGALPTLAVDAPTDAVGASGSTVTFDATVTLTTERLAVEALSLGLRADGCTITGATFAGTRAGDLHDDDLGLRDGGFARLDTSEAGVAAAVAWDIAGDARLPASETPQAVLAVSLSAPVTGACVPCTLTLDDGVPTGGVPITTVVSANGLAYLPERTPDTVQVCPG